MKRKKTDNTSLYTTVVVGILRPIFCISSVEKWELVNGKCCHSEAISHVPPPYNRSNEHSSDSLDRVAKAFVRDEEKNKKNL